jgi:DNA-binding response OmpR family regulator
MSERTAAATVLVVEDDASTALLLREILEAAGYGVVVAGTAAEAEQLLRGNTPPDLVILDLILPDMDGLVLLADIRLRHDVPVIVCTATHRKRDTLLAFRLGADDVVTKPFDTEEFAARARAVLRRATAGPRPARQAADAMRARAPRDGETKRVSNLEIDHTRRMVHLGDKQLHLTPTEYRLLRALSSRADEVLTRRDLAQQVWGFENVSAGRTIDVHIRRLRAKLAALDSRAPLIVSIRGEGYRLIQSASGTSGLSA